MVVRLTALWRLNAFAIVFALIAATTAATIVETVLIPRASAANAQCATGSVYSLGSAGNIYTMSTSTAARALVGTLPVGPSYNGMAITPGGSAIYAVNQSGSGTSTIYEFDPNSNTSTSFAGPVITGPYSFVMGGIDPVNGIYYMATPTATGVDVYGFDTATHTAITGRVARISGLVGGNAGGDLVFDVTGRMYIAFSLGNGSATANQLVRVDAAMPATGADSALSATLLTNLLPSTSSFNGVTFDGDGYLYVSSASTLTKLNPDTGAIVATTSIPSAVNGDNTDDLADCQYNGQLQLQADVAGRYRGSADQFALSITGGGITSGNLATTSGTSTGLQSASAATAGPVIGLPGISYEIHERAASGSLSNYAVTASCVDKGNGNGNGNASVALTPSPAGSTTDFSFVFPAANGSLSPALACTFTDTPLPSASISVTETLAASRLHDTDQFTAQIRTGSSAGPIVSSPAGETTTGTGATVGAGTGTTGAYLAAPGTTYYASDAAAGTTDLGSYHPTITCTDAAGLQSGLPSGVALTGALAITPVDGAAIACVISQGVQRYTLSASASATQALPGSVITYKVTLVNTGQVTYTGATAASFTDDLTGVSDDASFVTGSASATGGLLELTTSFLAWRGPLAASGLPGSTVVVGFSMRVNTPDTGNSLLSSQLTAAGSGGMCVSGCALSVPVQSFSVRPATSSASVAPGQLTTLTLTVTNTGKVAYPASPAGDAAGFTDDLSGVLDDVTTVTNSASASSGTVTLTGGTLSWHGALAVRPAAGSAVTVTFQVRINDPDTGDRSLLDHVTTSGPGGGTMTSNGNGGAGTNVQSFLLHQQINLAHSGSGVLAHFSVVLTNTGTHAFTAADPATFSDNLSGALDDAHYDNDGSAGVSFSAPTLTWTGALPVGATVTVTFSLTVNVPDTGDGQLTDMITTAASGGGSCSSAADPDCGVAPLSVSASALAFTGTDVRTLFGWAMLLLIAGLELLLFGWAASERQ